MKEYLIDHINGVLAATAVILTMATGYEYWWLYQKTK